MECKDFAGGFIGDRDFLWRILDLVCFVYGMWMIFSVLCVCYNFSDMIFSIMIDVVVGCNREILILISMVCFVISK